MVRRNGFTIIEMLAVMVIIGVLAGIAYVRVQSSKRKAVVASMTTDLRGVAEEQEAHYVENRTYTTDQVALRTTLSTGNALTIIEATPSGWSGRIDNPSVTTVCYVTVGSALPVGSATQDGTISCS